MLHRLPDRPLPRILAAAAFFVAIGATTAFSYNAIAAGVTTSPDRHDAWLARLNAPHRQLFDTPASGGGVPLVHVLNYYDTYNKAFGVGDKDVNAVLTFYGSTTFHGLSDAMWAKYQLGEYLGEKDAQGVPFTVNPWRANPFIMGGAKPAASIESLQGRGATFILCNNALSTLSGLVAGRRGLDARAVYEDMKANVLPQVTLVPAMVIAIEQAQKAGLAYKRQ